MATSTQRTIAILAVPHQLQGPNFKGYVRDPSYESLVWLLIGSVNFVFEEAAGCRPSVAERITQEKNASSKELQLAVQRVSEIQYVDVDSARRPPACLCNSISGTSDSYYTQFIDKHQEREEQWLRTILAKEFELALMVCGSAHGLSFAFRLQSAGIGNVELHEYLPYHKLG